MQYLVRHEQRGIYVEFAIYIQGKGLRYMCHGIFSSLLC